MNEVRRLAPALPGTGGSDAVRPFFATPVRSEAEFAAEVRAALGIQEGQRVRIDKGSLGGIEGIVVKSKKGAWRMVVSVTLLQRSLSVEIDREWISAIR